VGEGHAIDHGKALAFAFEWCEKHLPMVKLIAVGHRVVLGAALNVQVLHVLLSVG
jgi:hypothetical protein